MLYVMFSFILYLMENYRLFVDAKSGDHFFMFIK